MDWIFKFLDIVLHLNLYLGQVAGRPMDPGSYAPLLFLIIFSETGLVVILFLPGDALLFTVGTLTAQNGPLNLPLILVLLNGRGNSQRHTGKLLDWKQNSARSFSATSVGKSHFQSEAIWNKRTANLVFDERHGAKTILLSRFIPLIRTFAPFVAGMGSMSYRRFFGYNVGGAFVWVFGIVLLGHFFGNLPYVQKNYSLVILAIIVISMIPPGLEILRGWLGRSKAKM